MASYPKISQPNAWEKATIRLLEITATTELPMVLECQFRSWLHTAPFRILPVSDSKSTQHRWILNHDYDIPVPLCDLEFVIEPSKVSKKLFSKKIQAVDTFRVLSSQLELIPDGKTHSHVCQPQSIITSLTISFSCHGDVLFLPLLQDPSLDTIMTALVGLQASTSKLPDTVVKEVISLTSVWLWGSQTYSPLFSTHLCLALQHLLTNSSISVHNLEFLAPLDSSLFTPRFSGLKMDHLCRLLQIIAPYLKSGMSKIKTRLLNCIEAGSPHSPILPALMVMIQEMFGVQAIQNETKFILAAFRLIKENVSHLSFLSECGAFSSEVLELAKPRSLLKGIFKDKGRTYSWEERFSAWRLCALHGWIQGEEMSQFVPMALGASLEEDAIAARLVSRNIGLVLQSSSLSASDRQSIILSLVKIAATIPSPSKFKDFTQAMVDLLEKHLSHFDFCYVSAIDFCFEKKYPNWILVDHLMTSYFEEWRNWMVLNLKDRPKYAHPDTFHELFFKSSQANFPNIDIMDNKSSQSSVYEKLGLMAQSGILLKFHSNATDLNLDPMTLHTRYWIIYELFSFFPSLLRELTATVPSYADLISFALANESSADLPLAIMIISMHNALYNFVPGSNPLHFDPSNSEWVMNVNHFLGRFNPLAGVCDAQSASLVERFSFDPENHPILNEAVNEVFEIVLKLAGQWVGELSLPLTSPPQDFVQFFVEDVSDYSRNLAQLVSTVTSCLVILRNPNLVLPRIWSILAPIWTVDHIQFGDIERLVQMVFCLHWTLKPDIDYSVACKSIVPFLISYIRFWEAKPSRLSKVKLVKWDAEREMMIVAKKEAKEPSLENVKFALASILERADIPLDLLFSSLGDCKRIGIVHSILQPEGFRERGKKIIRQFDFSCGASESLVEPSPTENGQNPSSSSSTSPSPSPSATLAAMGRKTLSDSNVSPASLYSFYKHSLDKKTWNTTEKGRKNPLNPETPMFHLLTQFRAYIPTFRPFILLRSTCLPSAPESYRSKLEKFQKKAENAASLDIGEKRLSALWKPQWLHFDGDLWISLHRIQRFTSAEPSFLSGMDPAQFTTFHVALLQLMLDLPLGLRMERPAKYDQSSLEDSLIRFVAWPSGETRQLIFLLLRRIRSEHHFIQYPIFDSNIPTLLLGYPSLMSTFMSFANGETISPFSPTSPWRHSFHHSVLSILCHYVTSLVRMWANPTLWKEHNNANHEIVENVSPLVSTDLYDLKAITKAFYGYTPSTKNVRKTQNIMKYTLASYEIPSHKQFWFPPLFNIQSFHLHFSKLSIIPMFDISQSEWFNAEHCANTSPIEEIPNIAFSGLSPLNSALYTLSEQGQLCDAVINACHLASSLYSWAKECNDVAFTLSTLSDATPPARHTGTRMNCLFDFGWLFYALELIIGPLDAFVQKMVNPKTRFVPLAPSCPKRVLWALVHAASKACDIMPEKYQQLSGFLVWHLLQYEVEDNWSQMGSFGTGARPKAVRLEWSDMERILGSIAKFGPFMPDWPMVDLENLGIRLMPDQVTVIHQIVLDEVQNLTELGLNWGQKSPYVLSIALRLASLLETTSTMISQTVKTHPKSQEWFRDVWRPKVKELRSHPAFASPPSSPSSTSASTGDESIYSPYFAILYALDQLSGTLQGAAATSPKNVFLAFQLSRIPEL